MVAGAFPCRILRSSNAAITTAIMCRYVAKKRWKRDLGHEPKYPSTKPTPKAAVKSHKRSADYEQNNLVKNLQARPNEILQEHVIPYKNMRIMAPNVQLHMTYVEIQDKLRRLRASGQTPQDYESVLGPGAKPIVGTLRISADIGKDPSRCTFHDIGFVEDLLRFLRTLWDSNQITSAKFEDLLGRPLRHLKEMTCKDGKPIEMFFLGNRRWEYDLLYNQSMGGVIDTGRTPTSPHTTAVPMDSINLREWLALIAMVG